jgi:PPK2 family polyphosphate:nucleotide phosphotransferase
MTMMKNPGKFVSPFRVTKGSSFRLANIDPGTIAGTEALTKEQATALLNDGKSRLGNLQEMLYAQDRRAVLLIFQAMDAAGKDGAIKHVMSGIDPQGCQVYSFKSPSSEELDHDFLWRTSKALPERGRIGIFNRSYYEETLIVRVHPEILGGQKLPTSLVTDRIWDERFEDINSFERYLSRNGVVIRKFFLHISKEEQKERFLARLDDPAKNWKFSISDAREREHWDEYMAAYEDMIRKTSSKHAPWYVVPANKKWFARLVVAAAVIDALEELDLAFPEVTEAKRRELRVARRELLKT